MAVPGLYILHFDSDLPPNYRGRYPYGDARHYVGVSSDIAHRVRVHRSGKGAVVTRKAVEQGATFHLATVQYGATDSGSEAAATGEPTSYCWTCQGRPWPDSRHYPE